MNDLASLEEQLGLMDLNVVPFDSTASIPKIIHQTYSTRDLPELLSRNVDVIRKSNPDWAYMFYDDAAIEAFIAGNFGPHLLHVYNRIDPAYGAARADLFRYLVMYKEGGVYLDIKSRFTRPISDVLKGDEGFIASRWSNQLGSRYAGYGMKPELSHVPRGELQQWHIVAAPGHPFLRAVLVAVLSRIAAYRPWRDGTGKAGVLRLTGPIAYTLAIEPLLAKHPCTLIDSESEIGLEYSVTTGDQHLQLFPSHYSTIDDPIVQPNLLLWPAYKAYLLGRFLKRRFGYGRA